MLRSQPDCSLSLGGQPLAFGGVNTGRRRFFYWWATSYRESVLVVKSVLGHFQHWLHVFFVLSWQQSSHLEVEGIAFGGPQGSFLSLRVSMPISIQELATTDFSTVTTGNQLELVRPGDILLHDFMQPLGLSANALATALHIPTNRIIGILAATRGITADTALRLARYFGTTPQFWLNLQRNYDLRRAEAAVGAHIREEIAPRPMVIA